MLSQLVCGNKLARTEDTIDSPANLVLLCSNLLHIRYDSDGAFVDLAVLVKSFWMLVFNVSNNMVPVDEVLKKSFVRIFPEQVKSKRSIENYQLALEDATNLIAKMALEIAADDAIVIVL